MHEAADTASYGSRPQEVPAYYGGKATTVLYSIMASAQANQGEPYADVPDLLSQLSDSSPPAVAMLLSDA